MIALGPRSRRTCWTKARTGRMGRPRPSPRAYRWISCSSSARRRAPRSAQPSNSVSLSISTSRNAGSARTYLEYAGDADHVQRNHQAAQVDELDLSRVLELASSPAGDESDEPGPPRLRFLPPVKVRAAFFSLRNGVVVVLTGDNRRPTDGASLDQGGSGMRE